MNILIVSSKERVYRKDLNSFVSILQNWLQQFGHNVTCDENEIWHNFQNYDLLFFQFPSEINRNHKDLERVIEQAKLAGTRIAITCHDLEPLVENEENKRKYELLYEKADIIHHMGLYSYKIFCQRYPEKHHFIAHHPIYYDILAKGMDKSDCRKRLGLPAEARIVLAFGQFRNDAEILLFLNQRKNIPSDVLLFAQRIETGRLYNGIRFDKTFHCIRRRLWLHHSNFMYGQQRVDESLIPCYFTAADIVFLQRKKILNSGNLPLAFSAGKPVVGPNVGNVGEILKESGNYTFDPNDENSVSMALNHALSDMKIKGDSLGMRNHEYAIKNMTPQNVFSIIDKNLKQII